MANQYEPTILRKTMRTTPASALALHQAKAKGQVEVVPRAAAAAGPHMAQLDAHDLLDRVEKKKPHVTLEFRHALAQARQAKGLSQAELAKQINQTQKVVQDLESGKVIPAGQLIHTLNAKLGVALPKLPKHKVAKVDLDAN